jgi:hypothetical protein
VSRIVDLKGALAKMRAVWAKRRERFLAAVLTGEKGIACPCCERSARLQKRKLNSGLVRTLILLHRYEEKHGPAGGWIRISEEVKDHGVLRNRGYARLRFWGLLEPHTGAKRTKGENSNDTYRVTQKGARFVRGIEDVSMYVYVSDNRCWPAYDGDGDKTIGVRAALDNKFDYEELMRG